MEEITTVVLRKVRRSPIIVAPLLAAAVLVSLSACAPATTTPAAVGATSSSSSSSGSSSSGSGSNSGSGSSSKSGGGSSKEIDACSLVSAAAAGSDMGDSYISSVSSTIATGQDQCAYATSDDSQALVVIIYQPSSGMTWSTLQQVQSGVGSVTPVSGVGDKAQLGAIELDVQSGSRFIAIEGGVVTQNESGAEALAKAEIAALG